MNKIIKSARPVMFVIIMVCTGWNPLSALNTSDDQYIEGAVGNGGNQAVSTETNSDTTAVNVVPNNISTRELQIRGRIQSQYAYSSGYNSNTGVPASDYNSFEMRRIRLGVQGEIFGNFRFMMEANVLSDVDLDAAYLNYSFLPLASITFGKDKPQFGHEQNTSSAEILTFERTHLDGHLNAGKPLGLRLHGTFRFISYNVGVYNGESTGTDLMGSGRNSYLLNASSGLNLSGVISDELDTRFRADFLHRTNSSGYYGFENAFAISGHFGFHEMDLRVEYMHGEEQQSREISGFYILPSYFIIPERLQAVFRFETINSGTGLSLGHNRYADRIPDIYLTGDEYRAWFVGINYYIHSHNLKFMLGYELAENSERYSNVSGFASTIFTGFRMQI